MGAADAFNSGKIGNSFFTANTLEICGVANGSYASRKVNLYENVSIIWISLEHFGNSDHQW
jgi:hypothetical protein